MIDRLPSQISPDERASQLKRKLTSTFLGTNGTPGTGTPDIEAITSSPADIPPPPFPIHIAWQDIAYGIEVDDTEAKRCFQLSTPKKRRQLLCNVSGEARPGELTVILGPSGCGKTTLMNILSGRIKMHRKDGDGGVIFVNGEKRNKRFKRHTAFVLQEDLFFASLTVEQTLTLTGQLRIESSSEEGKLQRIRNMISLLKLEKCAKSRVGNHIRRGLSGGEKKRLNVANELLVDPALIFLDEPTSGLDAVLADELLNILSLLAKSGRTVITTLHQPSSQIYSMVDKLFLMAEGGRVAYFGPANQAVAYFSKLNFRCPRYYNPADFLLELVQHNTDLPDHYTPTTLIVSDGSGGFRLAPPTTNASIVLDDDVSDKSSDRLMTSTPPMMGKLEPIPTQGQKWPIGWSEQALLLGIRSIRNHFEVAIWNVFIFIFVAAIGAIVWWDRGHSYAAVLDKEGLMFFVLLQWFIFPMFGEVNSLVPEIPIITKERREGMYRLSAYAFGKTCGELILDIISPVTFSIIIYWTTGLNTDAYRFFTFTFIIFLAYLIGQAMGFGLAAWIGSVELASPLLLVIMFVAMLVSGFYASIDAIPSFFRWLQYINPLRYLFDSLIINEFACTCVYSSKVDNTTQTGYDIIDAYEPIIWTGDWASVWYNCLVIAGIAFVFRVFGFWMLRRRTSTTF